MDLPIGQTILYALISLFVILNYGLLLYGIMARIIAKVQGRIGIPVWQPYLDIIKNYARTTSVHHGIMFYLGPVFRLAGGVGTYLFIPAIYGSAIFGNLSFSGDVLLVMYFIFFGQLGMALGAGESGHPYSSMGVARGLAQMTAFEVPFALSVISVVVQYDTFSVTGIVAAQQGGILNWTALTNPLAMIAGMLALLGMNMHNPFGVVRAPQEIPVGPPTEFQSGYLGMLITNRSIFTAAKLVLFMNLYFGGATNIIEMVVKTFLIYFVNVFVGAAFPRFRVEQSIRFYLKVPLIIGLISVIIFMI
ncbi:MAG: respiratory chain complex I subunit 1 family protein [Candidatus Zixiibacteriota bacterium]